MKNKNVFTAIILILVFVVYYRFVLSGQLQKISLINSQIKVQSKLLEQNSIEKELLQNKILIKMNNFKLNILKRKVPLSVDIQKNIINIKNISEKNNIQIKNVQIENSIPIPITEKITLYENYINFTVTGLYNNLILFINELNNLKFINFIKYIKMSVYLNEVQTEFYILIYSIEGDY